MGPERVLRFSEPHIGLEAVIVIDSTALGPAVGGIRTAPYACVSDAEREACALARAMTVKCSVAGLDAGGGKAVLVERAGWNRAEVFRRLGELVQDLGGAFRTAGDLGTNAEDLRIMATTCSYVHADTGMLAQSVARGLVACIQSLAATKKQKLVDLRIAIQGCGDIGSALARSLTRHGVSVLASDLCEQAVASLESECGISRLAVDEFISAEVDVLSPCAVGHVVNGRTAHKIQAWGLCGGANNIVDNEATTLLLEKRGLLVVPDVISSAGAVIEGIGRTGMGLSSSERATLIDALGATTTKVLAAAKASTRSTHRVAYDMAMARLAQ